jgi:hypothetical protein
MSPPFRARTKPSCWHGNRLAARKASSLLTVPYPVQGMKNKRSWTQTTARDMTMMCAVLTLAVLASFTGCGASPQPASPAADCLWANGMRVSSPSPAHALATALSPRSPPGI